jgi:hypothetical protein
MMQLGEDAMGEIAKRHGARRVDPAHRGYCASLADRIPERDAPGYAVMRRGR